MELAQKKNFQKTLLAWYRKHKRDLPWRKTRDPYAVWISEIMLQQTQVAAVIDYYLRFLKRFPNVDSLAQATEEDVLALWSGLGYYSRAKNLHKAAQAIVREHRGKFPKDPESIEALPGIGRYTLGAIASIAFEIPLALVDGNVIRVYSRLFAKRGSPKESKFQKEIWKIAEQLVSADSPGDFNQGLMELGATLCTPQNPLCLLCPVQGFCKGRLEDPEKFPEKKKGPETKLLERVAAVIEKDGKVLLTLSEENRWMKGLWQLPSLFPENGDSPAASLASLLKKMGLISSLSSPLKSHTHAITHHRITIHPFWVQNPQGKMKKEAATRWEWFSPSQLGETALPSADRKILQNFVKEKIGGKTGAKLLS
ncbi:MAG: A/G-specific adenine glycosylase [bacterium]